MTFTTHHFEEGQDVWIASLKRHGKIIKAMFTITGDKRYLVDLSDGRTFDIEEYDIYAHKLGE